MWHLDTATLDPITDAEMPVPGRGEVLIQVAYAGVNRPDLLQRSGKYPPPPGASPIMGLEVSGYISAIGADVTQWKVADAVCALTPGGGYAEYCLAPAGHCLTPPEGLDLCQAAVLPENCFTVYENVINRGKLQKGETILIHGGSSGIGYTAIMMAKAWGATVISTVGSQEKKVFCESIGADYVINYREQDFVAEVAQITQNNGVNLILDMVGGPYIQKNIASLALEGRLVQIAFQKGASVELDVKPIMMKRLTFTGSTMRARSIEAKEGIAQGLMRDIWPLYKDKRMRPIINTVFPVKEAAQAHAVMQSSQHCGKLVLEVKGK